MDNWKKYLIEFVVIVGGILTAISLENWNQDRLDREKEKLLLAEMHQEFIENKNQLKWVVKGHKNTYNNSDRLLSLYPDKVVEIHIDTLRKLYRATFSNITYNPTQGTINSLIYSSSLDIISEDTLRQLVVKWNDLLEDFQEEEVNLRHFMQNFYTPYYLEHGTFNFHDPNFNVKSYFNMELAKYIRIVKTRSYPIFSEENGELQVLEKTIDDIIRLTAQKEDD